MRLSEEVEAEVQPGQGRPELVRDALDERLGPLMPALEALLKAQGSSVDELAQPLLPRVS